MSFAEQFKLSTVAPIIDCGFGVAGQGDNILHGHDILIFAEQFGVVVVHLPTYILRQFFGELRHIVTAVPPSGRNKARGKRLAPQDTPRPPLF